MSVETRYFRNDTDTINGLLAYLLKTLNTTSALEFYIGDNTTAYVGIRVWKRTSDGTETEITSGSAVAIASLASGISAYVQKSATWDCPQTSLASTDAIIVRIYGDVNSTPPTTLMRTFITEQMGATQLDAATWTVYYWIRRIRIFDGEGYVYGFWYVHGSDTRNSRIANFSWSSAPPPVGGVLAQII